MPDNTNFDNKQHSFGAGRIRRAGAPGPDAQSPNQAFGWEAEAGVARPAQPAPPRPKANAADGRASLFQSEEPARGSLFDYDGDGMPAPAAQPRQSLFDYDTGEPLLPQQPSAGYTEQYLAGGSPQSPGPRAVFDFEQDDSTTAQAAGRPRRPSRMQQQRIEVPAPSRMQPQRYAEEPQAAAFEGERRPRAAGASGRGAPPPRRVPGPQTAAPRQARRPATVFDAFAQEDGGQAPPTQHFGWEGPPPAPPHGRATGDGGGQRRRKRRWPVVVLALLLVFGIAGALFVHYTGNLLDPGVFGRILPNLDVPPSPYSKKEVLHLLVVGIDYEEGRQYADGLGLTDMILYCRYDIKNNKMNLLQVPRDSYVGESWPTGGTGKINALLISGENKESPINNLAGPFQSMFQLPVDNYIAMDMDALKTIVDTFGGLQVFVPQEMSYDGSYLAQGWQTLDGNAAEFFVRNRHGEGFGRGDIDRLDNQRHFYSALFRRLLNLTPGDVANLFPVFDHYCNTDLSLPDMIGLGVAALNLKAEDVLFAKVPGATGEGLDPTGQGRSLYIVDKYGRGTEEEPGLANLLNTYFRGEGEAVPAEALQWPDIDIPASYALYPPNVQGMADVQTPEGGAAVDVEPKA